MIDIGQDFCNKNSDSSILIKTTKDQTVAYFKSFHLSHLEELKMFLENETWQLCPVIDDFSIFKLQEYKFLKTNNSSSSKSSQLVFKEYFLNESNVSNSDSTINSSVSTNNESSIEINNNMKSLLTIDNPFEIISNVNDQNENIFTENESTTNTNNNVEELNTSKEDKNNIPIITYTSLNIIRLFGKYIHMLSIFKIISNEVISYLMQLFYFYLYYVYYHFVTEEVCFSKFINYDSFITNFYSYYLFLVRTICYQLK